MVRIIITIVVMFLVLIFWSFTNLGKIKISKKNIVANFIIWNSVFDYICYIFNIKK